MKKKIFLMLPCIAAVAIATFVGKKTFESHVFESDLLSQNVEALSQTEFSIPIPCAVMLDEKCPFNITDTAGKVYTLIATNHIKPSVFK